MIEFIPDLLESVRWRQYAEHEMGLGNGIVFRAQPDDRVRVTNSCYATESTGAGAQAAMSDLAFDIARVMERSDD